MTEAGGAPLRSVSALYSAISDALPAGVLELRVRRGLKERTDSTYIPCVSLLDFWLPGGAVELVAYAHSIDFGAKGYGNLVELAWLQRHVAGALEAPAGRLLMIVKSAHVYETEFGYVRGVLEATHQ